MVLIITPNMRSEHSVLIERTYLLRAKIIRHWKWNIPDSDPYRDVDEFDGEDTVYFIDVDENTGAPVGTVRLNPTNKPHLLSEVFPHLCSASVPRSDKIWEATRYMTDTLEYSEFHNVRSRLRLALALNEYALSNGIEQMSWLTTVPLYRKMINLWVTTPLGLPEYFEDDDNTYLAAISTFAQTASDILSERLQASLGPQSSPNTRPTLRA